MHYAVLVIGALLVLENAGINLTTFAVVGSALAVGVGFGLQNIISNFISGLIILLERPIEIGNRIELGGVEGIVQEIGARRTTVITPDQIAILVPNQKFITDNVTNYVYVERTSGCGFRWSSRRGRTCGRWSACCWTRPPRPTCRRTRSRAWSWTEHDGHGGGRWSCGSGTTRRNARTPPSWAASTWPSSTRWCAAASSWGREAARRQSEAGTSVASSQPRRLLKNAISSARARSSRASTASSIAPSRSRRARAMPGSRPLPRQASASGRRCAAPRCRA